MKHAKRSMSSAARWVNCPGSVDLCDGLPDESSAYAEEGTRAHTACEQMLRGMSPTFDDDEMKRACQVYVDFVREQLAAIDGLPKLYLELTMNLSDFPHDIGGTADAIIVHEYKLVHVIDFKYGSGVPVSAVDNDQLKGYLWLAYSELVGVSQWCVFRASIVQPRTAGDPIETVDYTWDEIAAFRFKALSSIEEPYFQPGDHCRWCPAMRAGICEHVQSQALALAKEVFPSIVDDATRERWLKLLQVESAVKAIYKELGARVLEDMERGGQYPGFKAVQSLGNRSWIDDQETVMKKLRRRGIGSKITMPRKILTPAQLEKEIRDTPLQIDFSDLVTRKSKGAVVVPNADKRAAIDFATPADVFEDHDAQSLLE